MASLSGIIFVFESYRFELHLPFTYFPSSEFYILKKNKIGMLMLVACDIYILKNMFLGNCLLSNSKGEVKDSNSIKSTLSILSSIDCFHQNLKTKNLRVAQLVNPITLCSRSL